MVRDLPDVPAPVKKVETAEEDEEDEDEKEQPILGHVSMATDLVSVQNSRGIRYADVTESWGSHHRSNDAMVSLGVGFDKGQQVRYHLGS
jgi:hypothetical protein